MLLDMKEAANRLEANSATPLPFNSSTMGNA